VSQAARLNQQYQDHQVVLKLSLETLPNSGVPPIRIIKGGQKGVKKPGLFTASN